jgi:glutamate 5-kinase
MIKDVLTDRKRIVIKIGSALLVDASYCLKLSWLESLTADVALLIQLGKQVIIVSSGSIALGRAKLLFKHKPLQLPEKQAAAAVGQIELARAYDRLFFDKGILAAQVLLTLRDSEDRRSYINAKNTLNTLLELSVVPIINENDTVATTEIRYGDNDRLAAIVTQMVEADCLVLFSDVDGLYTENPSTCVDAKRIPIVENIDAKIEAMAGDSHTNIGSGGMKTKIAAAKISTACGADMIICDGKQHAPILVLRNEGVCTVFKAQTTPKNARKRWIAHHLNPAGSLVVDHGAEKALYNGKSLLAVGVKEVLGLFLKGDVLSIRNEAGQCIATGISSYSAEELTKIKGLHGSEIAMILHYCSGQPVIHRNNLVLIEEK